MNERLEKFAKQAPLLKSYDYPDLRLVDDDQLERFAELVRDDERGICAKHYLVIVEQIRKDEREACAKLCDDWFASTAGQAIRERGNK
jgi:hypothetical protein